MSRGILAVGAYAPENRAPAEAFEEAWGRFDAPGVETKAVPDADEDALTMGVEAARRALLAGEVDGDTLDRLAFATTTPPLAEEDLTPRLGSYLGAPADATRRTYTGSTRAGVDALFDAIETGGTALVVVADCPEGEPDDSREHAAGAGAVALLVGDDAPAVIAERATHADTRPGTRFREHGSETLDGLDIGTYDRAAFTDPVETAVDGLDASGADTIALQAPNGKLPYRSSLDNEAIAAVETVSELGDTAAASVPLSLAVAFEDDYDRTLAVAWGSGAGATAFHIEGTAPVETALSGSTDLDYPAYLRRRGDIVGEKPDGGAAHVPVPTWRRSLPQRHRHEAGRCPDCGAVAFPPEGACPDCRGLVEFDPVEPSLFGTVDAATTIGQGGAPPEFAEQQARQGAFGVAVVRFPAGEDEVSLPMQVLGEASVDDEVKAVPRRVYVEEGVPRYGLKALPQSD
ncbi:MAG: hydroxymethylglutaryl-CoA synthase [Natronomonas sp.]|jgi:hydroxymethylglutaryl-CoA synthase|uniref:zinc ribbon domain-containing protein n=1 Tax=Natronomonas sp. TaxID=2184060 RepID=UPI0039E68DDF